jgi:hypothetical protein
MDLSAFAGRLTQTRPALPKLVHSSCGPTPLFDEGEMAALLWQ